MVRSFKPKSEFLARYIVGFSVFEKGCDLRMDFVTFPHVGPALALLKNAELDIRKNHMQIFPTGKIHYNTIILGKYMYPVFISYHGYVDEISMNFTPLGINYFFKNFYSEMAPRNFQPMTDRNWLDFVPKIFSAEDLEEQLQLLEDFLLSQFREKNLDKLQQTVDLFMDKTEDYRVAEVAEITGVTERTLRRSYKKYIGCSPQMFKRIVRFRNAIDVSLIKQKRQNITQLGHEYLFYDSSHFAREYKFFTGRNPKTFFNEVSFLGNSIYPYIFF